MNSPYGSGKFRVSQIFKGTTHAGIDLVGVDSKNLYATVDGVVEVAGPNDPKGFGTYVRIKGNADGYRYYYGHMKSVSVNVGQYIKKGTLIGVEGSTGRSSGPHCHYEIRKTTSRATFVNVCDEKYLGIDNVKGVPAYFSNTPAPAPEVKPTVSTTTGTYTVVQGDSLWKIAENLMGDGRKYKELASFNNIAVDSIIRAGQVLKIPVSSAITTTYTVVKGDSLWKIAEKTMGDGNKYKELAAFNGISESAVIYGGQVLKIPAAQASTIISYTVVQGDSLWKIADKILGSGKRYPEIAALNGISEKSILRAGQVLKIKKN